MVRRRAVGREHRRPAAPRTPDDAHARPPAGRPAGRQGLLGLGAPEKYGGAGADILFSAVLIEEQHRQQLSGPSFALHSDMIMPYVYNYGTEAQKQQWLPGMCKGTLISAVAMTEPGTGSDLQAVRTAATLTPDGRHFVINGQKTFISNGQLADLIVVVCKTDPTKGASGISLIVVEADRKGFVRGRKLKKIGLMAQDTSELFFDNVTVPVENLLGTANHGFRYLMHGLIQERLVIGIMALASAEGAYEETLRYVKDRRVFGQTVFDFQTTRFNLAEMKTELAVGQTFLDRCLALHAQRKLDGPTAAMAKVAAAPRPAVAVVATRRR